MVDWIARDPRYSRPRASAPSRRTVTGVVSIPADPGLALEHVLGCLTCRSAAALILTNPLRLVPAGFRAAGRAIGLGTTVGLRSADLACPLSSVPFTEPFRIDTHHGLLAGRREGATHSSVASLRRTVARAYRSRWSTRPNGRERNMKLRIQAPAWLGRGDEPVSQAAFCLDVSRSV